MICIYVYDILRENKETNKHTNKQGDTQKGDNFLSKMYLSFRFISLRQVLSYIIKSADRSEELFLQPAAY